MIKNMYVFLCEYCIKQKRNIYIYRNTIYGIIIQKLSKIKNIKFFKTLIHYIGFHTLNKVILMSIQLHFIL